MMFDEVTEMQKRHFKPNWDTLCSFVKTHNRYYHMVVMSQYNYQAYNSIKHSMAMLNEVTEMPQRLLYPTVCNVVVCELTKVTNLTVASELTKMQVRAIAVTHTQPTQFAL